MNFNFDEIIDRTGTHSEKWDSIDCELPMWVADMDFKAAPCILDALQNKVNHGILGYSFVPDEWYEAYINWWDRRHHFKINKDWLLFCTGTIPAISSMIRRLTQPGDNILMFSPIYNHFFNSINNNGRNALECPLIFDGNCYFINWIDFEAKLANPDTTLLIFCNPQNPSGIIWDRETLEEIGDLCKKYNVTVISDEIHCDITDPGREYIPFASVSETNLQISITCIAPSKCFNIAGLKTAAVFIFDPFLRQRISKGFMIDEIHEPNAFAIDATVAAFNDGEDWLNAFNEYVYENKKIVLEYVLSNIPQIKIIPSDATYLLWIDCSKVCNDSKMFVSHLRKKTGLFVSNGKQFGAPGLQFIRLNIACPKEYLYDGLNRLKEGIESFEN